MAGRARTMARKVAKVEQRLNKLAQSLFDLMPRLYKERTESLGAQTLASEAWNEAICGMGVAHAAMEKLCGILQEKADGLPEPEPCPFVQIAQE